MSGSKERALLYFEDPRQRRWVESIGGKPVNRFGRQPDDLPFSQKRNGAQNRLLRGRATLLACAIGVVSGFISVGEYGTV